MNSVDQAYDDLVLTIESITVGPLNNGQLFIAYTNTLISVYFNANRKCRTNSAIKSRPAAGRIATAYS